MPIRKDTYGDSVEHLAKLRKRAGKLIIRTTGVVQYLRPAL